MKNDEYTILTSCKYVRSFYVDHEKFRKKFKSETCLIKYEVDFLLNLSFNTTVEVVV
jgi:hypothetical protein